MYNLFLVHGIHLHPTYSPKLKLMSNLQRTIFLVLIVISLTILNVVSSSNEYMNVRSDKIL